MLPENEVSNACAPRDTRIYAIGDVHGRADLLGSLQALIAKDADRASETRKVVVYLGDYVDRGPDSAGVIDRLINGPLAGLEQVFLMGNHEAFFLEFLENPEAGTVWIKNGGDATLASYGLKGAKHCAAKDLGKLSKSLQQTLPEEHLDFLKGLSVSHREEDYLFVHAGIRPGVPLDRQCDDDMLWIREPFLKSSDEHEVVVVHGHTPVDAAEVHNNRIAIDTGAVWSGCLTAAVLHGERQSFLHT
jgi:diadenosine tetraphosphatase ApaH/serine/threonine PP2A family protein phosphatase